MQKPLVFISHITEEKEIAQALKQLVESTFLNMIEVFVSSDPTSIRLGRKWLDEITHALKTCSVEIILASPESVKRPWINFEGGSGWVRDIPVIPLCHSGMIPSKLPAPLGSLQAATATEEAELKLIFPELADAVGCKLPEIDFSKFITVVKEFEATSQQYNAMVAKTPVAITDGLSPHELATLAEIAECTFGPSEAVPIGWIRERLGKSGYRGVAVALALKILARKDLIEITTQPSSFNEEEYMAARATDEGWRWLEANQDKLPLVNEPKQAGAVSSDSLVSNLESTGEVPF